MQTKTKQNGRTVEPLNPMNPFPRLTWWQRLRCKHWIKIPIYKQTRSDGVHQVQLIGYQCPTCSRKLPNPYRRRRSGLLPAFLCLTLAALLLAWWFLYMR